jgi:hypothetical protein
VLFITEIKSKSLQTQLNSIYYTELDVSTYFRSSSGSQFAGRNINIYIPFSERVESTNSEPEDDLK